MKNKEVVTSKNSKKLIILAVFLVAFAGVVVLLVNLFNPKTVYRSNGAEITGTTSLSCTTKSKNIPEAFFDVSKAENASQSIKVIFKNRKMSDISYTADITYGDADTANTEKNNLNTKYNLFAQDAGKDVGIFTPNFSASGNNVKITLYADRDKLTPDLAKIFLIDTGDSNLDNYSSTKVLSTLYKTKGFSCEVRE